MDPVGSVLWRVVRPLSPALHARLQWARDRRHGEANLEIVEQLVRPGDVVVDAGANVGLFGYRLASFVGGDGHVHVIEPVPMHSGALERLARRPNVSFHPVALSDADGRAQMRMPVIDGEVVDTMATLESGAADGPVVDVEVTTFDGLLAAEGRPLAFVKMDVEGHEHEALLGARERLGRDQPALLIEIEQRHRARPLGETFDLLGGLGYAGYAVRDDGLLPLERFDLDRDQLDHVRAAPEGADMPPSYVHDFLFVSPRRPLPAGARVVG